MLIKQTNSVHLVRQYSTATTFKLFLTHDAAKTQTLNPSWILIDIDVQLASCTLHAIEVPNYSCMTPITFWDEQLTLLWWFTLLSCIFFLWFYWYFVFSIIIDFMIFLKKILSKRSQIQIQFEPIQIQTCLKY